MKKIQYNVYKRDTGNASGKAKKDCMETLDRMGFTHLYEPSDIQLIRVCQQFISLASLVLKKEKKIFAFQYPAVHESLYPLIIKNIREGDISIAIVHDLLALQNDLSKETINDEVSFLSHFKYIIVPNMSMLELLYKNGCKTNLVNMGIYDYLHDANRTVVERAFGNSICFAGNLKKSLFLQQLDKILGIEFFLYGKEGEHLKSENVIYKGCLPADELVYLLEGDYGLVWDGDSIEVCSGTVGRYLLYNSPHKLSAYISAEKPIITWRKAAIAEFVKQNDIGVVVGSLKELEKLDLQRDFQRYKKNIIDLKKKLASGFYLENAISYIFEVEHI